MTNRDRHPAMIALIIALAVLALGWMVAGVGATPAGQTSAEETRLQFSHMCITQNAQAEVHFVLIDPPQNVTNWGAVAYTMTVPTGQTVSREAPFDRVTGNAAHYLDLAPSGGPGEYVFVEGHVIVDGARYDLANPGPRQVGYCSPTSIEVRAFVVESTKLDNPMLPLVVAAIAVIVLVGVLLKVLKVGQSH